MAVEPVRTVTKELLFETILEIEAMVARLGDDLRDIKALLDRMIQQSFEPT